MEYGFVGEAWGIADLRGEYDILGEIGRGGSAVVFRARDRDLGREVAVKVVRPHPTSPDDDPVARLAREARTAAQLQHPNIVAVYAVRRLRGGGLALVMQFVPGDTLKTRVQHAGPLAPEHCERVLRDVSTALAYAHARGVVHRDVKPENIFLDEDTGRAMLADFGIARSANADSMTMTGTTVGTPFYMSPEQVDGGVIDGRSDLYSLGLVAWEMLTGQRPWDGESLYNVIYKQKHEELPPVEALRPGVPLRLQYIVERMLQKHPAARWAGAEGLLAQLGHTVLPGDYAHWQRALRARVVRHRKEAERRAADHTAGATTPTSASATLHFARPSHDVPSGTLAHTLAVPVGTGNSSPLATAASGQVASVIVQPDSVLPKPGVTIDLRPSEGSGTSVIAATPVYADTVEPSWTRAERPSQRPHVRVLKKAAVLTAVVGGGAIAHSYQNLRPQGFTTLATQTEGGITPIVRERIVAPLGAGSAGAGGGASRSDYTNASADRRGPIRPTAVGLGTRSVLTAGGRHTCALGIAGSLYCWGANASGQLGDGATDMHTTPAPVVGVFTFTSVAGGGAHTCATTRLGDVYCWGGDSSGQLGDATTVRRNAPVRIAGAGIYSSVAAGAAHSCAVTSDGPLRCWGANDQGQLGDGTRINRSTPQPVQLDNAVAHVAAGGQHTCAALVDGRLFCWGANTQGQLGNGTHNTAPMPTTAVALSRPVSALSAGLAHTCAITDDGTGWCWGRNDSGQLGNDTHASQATPARVRVPPGHIFVAITSGAAHSCALDDGGNVWCWGQNRRGNLGDGTRTTRWKPVRVRLPAAATAVAAGAAHTCTMLKNGVPLCWGENSSGQLGDGTHTNRTTPTFIQLLGNRMILPPRPKSSAAVLQRVGDLVNGLYPGQP